MESIRKRSKKRKRNLSPQTSRDLRLPDEKPSVSKKRKKRPKARRKKRESVSKMTKLKLHFSNKRLNFDKQRIAKFLFLQQRLAWSDYLHIL